jgi:hypothetical protein
MSQLPKCRLGVKCQFYLPLCHLLCFAPAEMAISGEYTVFVIGAGNAGICAVPAYDNAPTRLTSSEYEKAGFRRTPNHQFSDSTER